MTGKGEATSKITTAAVQTYDSELITIIKARLRFIESKEAHRIGNILMRYMVCSGYYGGDETITLNLPEAKELKLWLESWIKSQANSPENPQA